MGHPQPLIPLHCDNATAVGIPNKNMKHQKSKAMNMRYFWILPQIQQGNFDVICQPGQESLGDYSTKHHPAAHHQRIRTYFVHMSESPRYLPRALAPYLLQGCAEKPQKDLTSYGRQTPLPRKKTKNVITKNSCITQAKKVTCQQPSAKVVYT
eukprot:13445207-Ditylum_brightwellii.AAC.1